MMISRLCWRPAAKMSNAPVLVLIQALVLGETERFLVVCCYISFNFNFLGVGWREEVLCERKLLFRKWHVHKRIRLFFSLSCVKHNVCVSLE